MAASDVSDGGNPSDDDERAHAEALDVAKRVTEGTDGISVPTELIEEPAEPRPVSQPEKPLWIRVRDMTVAEKVKLALRGNKDARAILIHDSNKVIPRFVMQNPRLTEEEVLLLAKDRNTQEEILRTIADSRAWTKIYAVRAALVENARTPAGKALNLLTTLDERDIGRLAKSKQVPNVISAQARRLMFQALERRR
jgi:hypothetical protein